MTVRTKSKNTLPDLRAPHERLSCMQYHVAHAIARGERNTAIGRFLSIHRSTVRRYELRILNAMGLVTRNQIKTYALTHGVFGMKKAPRVIVKCAAPHEKTSVNYDSARGTP